MSPHATPASRALVTGATSGIGLEFARQLAASGHDLVLVARNQARLEDVAAELRTTHGVDTEVLAADLGDRTQLARAEARLADTDRPVGLLVNNAGFGLKDKFLDNDVEAEQAMLDVLVTAVMRLTHAAMRAMVERGGGGIINVSSVAGFLPRGTYGAAKRWVTHFGEWASAEYKPRGITLTTVCPGFVVTEFHERLGSQEGAGFMWMDAEFLVRKALADHAKGRALSVPGRQYQAIVRAARLVPASTLQRFQTLGRD
jgi:uncharacterized protein